MRAAGIARGEMDFGDRFVFLPQPGLGVELHLAPFHGGCAYSPAAREIERGRRADRNRPRVGISLQSGRRNGTEGISCLASITSMNLILTDLSFF